MAQVQIIYPYSVSLDEKELTAAYCRVSTDKKDQLNSYYTQINYYTKLVTENLGWQLVDIYADEGITGTSIAKRDGFNRMMEDCRAGKIKRIFVKSVSRFARNTIELIETTRELKKLGVVVVFEEQEIDTSQMLGEMQLTMHAIAAQEESHSISKNMRWSIQKRMERGELKTTCPSYGFRLESGNLIPRDDEVGVVEIMSNLASQGVGRDSIAKTLNQLKIPTRKGKEKWLGSTVGHILLNEKNIGDCLLQKEYTPEILPFRKIKNHGEVSQYYIKDDHPAIMDHQLYHNLKQLAEDRAKSYTKHADHLFTHRILCPDCQKHFRHVASNKKSYWICPNRANKLTECSPYRFREDAITGAFLNLAGKLHTYKESILMPTISLLQEAENKQTAADTKLYEIGQEIVKLTDKILVLQQLKTKGFIDDNDFQTQNKKLTSERHKLSEKRKTRLQGLKSSETLESIKILLCQIESWPEIPIEFNIHLFDDLVDKIIPCDKNKLKFCLKCGIELMEVVQP